MMSLVHNMNIPCYFKYQTNTLFTLLAGYLYYSVCDLQSFNLPVWAKVGDLVL